jgi:hypothetical protein
MNAQLKVDFFYKLFQRLIGAQAEDSCGKSGVGETPEAIAEEAPRPRKAKACAEIISGIKKSIFIKIYQGAK